MGDRTELLKQTEKASAWTSSLAAGELQTARLPSSPAAHVPLFCYHDAHTAPLRGRHGSAEVVITPLQLQLQPQPQRQAVEQHTPSRSGSGTWSP